MNHWFLSHNTQCLILRRTFLPTPQHVMHRQGRWETCLVKRSAAATGRRQLRAAPFFCLLPAHGAGHPSSPAFPHEGWRTWSPADFWFRFPSNTLSLMTETKEKNRGMALKWTCCQPGLYSHLGGCSRAHAPRSYCKKFQSCLERLVSSVTEAVGCNFLLLKKSKAFLWK